MYGEGEKGVGGVATRSQIGHAYATAVPTRYLCISRANMPLAYAMPTRTPRPEIYLQLIAQNPLAFQIGYAYIQLIGRA